MKILLDTNVLTRSFNAQAVGHQTAVDANILLLNRNHELCVVPQNFYEFWVVSTRPLAQHGFGKTPDEALVDVNLVQAEFTLLPDGPAIFSEWLALIAMHKVMGKPAHDARFVAAMLVHGVTHILTFNDKDFRRYPQITVLTPADVVAAGGP